MCAVPCFPRQHPENIVRLDAAAIENPEAGGVAHGEILPRAAPQEPMSVGGNFRGGGAALADGPNRFVCNQNTGELLRGQRAGAAAELPAENSLGKSGVAVLLSFSQANDGSEAVRQRDQGVLGDLILRLSKKLPALPLADHNLTPA